MLSYSPVDNIRDGVAYPAILVTGGLNDPRVQYWEPAKFVAKLRYAMASSEDGEGVVQRPPLFFKTDMAAGHFSASDRYKNLKVLAFEYAFILDQILPHE